MVNMFTIWYTLFSIFYLTTNVLHFLLCRILKLNSSLFNLLFAKIDSLFNFYSTLLNATTSLDSSLDSSLGFKNLYSEYLFFSKKNIILISKKNSFENTIMFCTLNNLVFSSSLIYSLELNYISFVSKILPNTRNLNNRKLNLNLFFNKILSLNFFTNKSVLYFNENFQLIKSNAKYAVSLKKIIKNLTLPLVLISENFFNRISTNWVIKFSPSNFIKYIISLNINTYNILYLRKAKVFNKGRYSRNRQYYRTGVYWCLYVNIIAVVGIYFWFYRFTMNFGYLWWLLFAFICSFIIPKAIKYRFYNPLNLVNSLAFDIIWIGSLLLNINKLASSLVKLLILFFKSYFINFQFFQSSQFNLNFKNFMTYYFTFLQFNNWNLHWSPAISIYTWEFNYTNYYCTSILQSRPIFFEKFKSYVLRLLSIVLR